jgi:formylglycine-generating enzyme required for sulfatase activity
MSLRALFEQHGLMEHLPAFERERVAVRDLAELTEQELSESFGVVSFGDRKRFRALVASLVGASASAPTPTPIPASPPAGATRVDAPLSAASTPPSPTAGATRVDAAGGLPARIGSYRILGLVGSGGMGTVVRARHAEDGWAAQQGGDVAIKLIHPEIASSAEFRSRFMTEAGLGRRLQHPGLVPVYDVVSDGPWLGTVMGLVLGLPLSQRIVPGGLSVGEVAALLEPLGSALDHLHSHGVVHRDVKPANIVVRADGSPVLLDLGIAKDTRSELGSHTRTMTALGTSAWMAPEQADAKHVDGAADRYAFGLLAYALLAGRMPWGADATELSVLLAKVQGKLEALSVTKPGVSGSVSTAVMSMLSLSPSERPSSCAAFMARLRTPEVDTLREREAAAQAERVRQTAAAEAAQAAKEAADRQAREDAELRARAEAEQQARAAAEAKAEAERQAHEDAERRAKSAADRRAREEAEQKAKADAEEIARAASARDAAIRGSKKSYVVRCEHEIVESSGFLGIGRRVRREARQASFETVSIPAGEFEMGSPSTEEGRFDDETQHRVRVTRGFEMGVFPVTQALYAAVMGTNPSHFKGDQRPVEMVSWFDAVRLCNAVSRACGLPGAYSIGSGDAPTVSWSPSNGGFRLPTESEWEYAARAGTSHIYAGGDDLDIVGWHVGSRGGQTQAVGQKRPNTWGIHDMSGNVWEWCWDWKSTYPTGPVSDPTGPASGSYRVSRGGSWGYDPQRARVALRSNVAPGYRNGNLGVRLLRTVT